LGQSKSDNNNCRITLSVITLSGFHCINNIIDATLHSFKG
jgi:hypothetical protein